MELFWKSAAMTVLAALLELALKKQQKDTAVLLTVGVIVMGAAVVLKLLEPVLELLGTLQTVGRLDGGSLELLLKAAGLGLTAELGGLVCSDAGNEALGKLIRLLGTAAILCLSVPMFTALLECILEMVGYA